MTKDLFKKIGDTKGTFHGKMGTKKTEMVWIYQKQKTLKRGGNNTQKNYTKKVLMTKITIVVWSLTYSQTSWSVKWALGSITMSKADGGDEILAVLFYILKNDAVKVLHSIDSKFENSILATELEKVSFHSSPKEGQCQRMFKLSHNCTHFTCQPGFNSTWTKSFQMYKLDLEKGEEPEIKLPISLDHRKSKGTPEKRLHWLC